MVDKLEYLDIAALESLDGSTWLLQPRSVDGLTGHWSQDV